MSTLHQINADGSISLSFGCAVKTYILSLPIVKGACFKCQSWQKLNQAIQKNLVAFKCEEGAIDFKGWMMNTGMTKSTNCLDDRFELTGNGQSYVNQIQQGLISDLCVWHWVFYCAGDKNCQRACGGFRECVLNCLNYQIKNNLKNGNDMHKCKVCIITKIMLSMVKERFLIKLYTEDQEQLEQQEKYGINSCSKQKIQQLLERNNQYTHNNVGPWTILHSLVINELKQKGFALYYQHED
ncbi:gephyrin: PROVISIONAL [Gigaspora margarita]|uniref:Gephyrin: PROVISIONAL n=1 Tax=Gigaspora margarita TaxID=4874 RepID=A0A8H4AYJ9_GIGMA|nr:gephyrin: PROVISIONAL [Gigaspora margarita]